MELYTNVEFWTWSVAPPLLSSRGTKIAPILDAKGRSPTFRLSKDADLTTPFGASAYDPANPRLSLDMRLEEEQIEWFEKLQDHIMKDVASKSASVLGKVFTEGQVEEHMKKILTKKDGYQPTLRTKLSKSGPRACQLWTNEGAQILGEWPDLKKCRFAPVLELKGLYLAPKEIGCIFEVTHLKVDQVTPPCPFEFETE